MKLLRKKPLEKRTITTTLTETEAKIVAHMRAYRAVNSSWRKKIGVLAVAGLMMYAGMHAWVISEPKQPLYGLSVLAGVLFVGIWIWCMDRKRKQWREQERHRMQVESKLWWRHDD